MNGGVLLTAPRSRVPHCFVFSRLHPAQALLFEDKSMLSAKGKAMMPFQSEIPFVLLRANVKWARLNEHKSVTAHLEKAMKLYEKVLTKMDSANVYAANGLGMVLALHGKFDAAFEVFSNIREGDSDVPQVWLHLGHICVARGDYKKAIRLYMQTSQRFYMGKNVKVLLYLANAYFLVGQEVRPCASPRARSHYEATAFAARIPPDATRARVRVDGISLPPSNSRPSTLSSHPGACLTSPERPPPSSAAETRKVSRPSSRPCSSSQTPSSSSTHWPARWRGACDVDALCRRSIAFAVALSARARSPAGSPARTRAYNRRDRHPVPHSSPLPTRVQHRG